VSEQTELPFLSFQHQRQSRAKSLRDRRKTLLPRTKKTFDPKPTEKKALDLDKPATIRWSSPIGVIIRGSDFDFSTCACIEISDGALISSLSAEDGSGSFSLFFLKNTIKKTETVTNEIKQSTTTNDKFTITPNC
jgi:hypothetical protein